MQLSSDSLFITRRISEGFEQSPSLKHRVTKNTIPGELDDENRDIRRGWEDGLPLDRQPEQEFMAMNALPQVVGQAATHLPTRA